MPDLKSKREDEIDKQYGDFFNNHHELHDIENNVVQSYANSDTKKPEKEANNPTKNIDATSDAEQKSGFYRQSSKYDDNGRKNPLKLNRRKSPLVALLLLLGLGGVSISLLSPALLLVQIKETMVGKFNDQLATMDIRSRAILKKKLTTNVTKGLCSPVKIKCKYRSMGPIQKKRLEKAGFKVNEKEGGVKIPGRTKPTSFEFNGKTYAAGDLLGEASRNPELRAAFRKGYNPLYAGFSDKVATNLRGKLGLSKKKNIEPGDKEKMKQELQDKASGEDAKSKAGGARQTKDENGNTTYEDADGNKISKEKFNSINGVADELEKRAKLGSIAKDAVAKGAFKSIATSFALGAGIPDSLCTGWRVLRTAAFAAKVYQSRQLIRYAYVFANTADSIKDGTATPEEVGYLGNILTSVNKEGKNATDSDGYQFAAYGDTFNTGDYVVPNDGKFTEKQNERNELQNETSRYVNGQILPQNIIASLAAKMGQGGESTAKIDDFCGAIKSWQGQTIIFGAAIVGAVVAVFSGGTSVSAGAVLQGAALVAVSVSIGLLTPKLIDMAKGKVVTGDENGNEAGNALTSGMGAYNAQNSQARGLGVLKKQDVQAYQTRAKTVAASYAEEERATHSPFDASNQNTFLGSIVANMLPYVSKTSSLSATLTSASSFVGSTLSSLFSTSSFAAESSSKQYESCSDLDYNEKSLAADPFCNLRYGMTDKELAIDPEDVVDYMVKNGYIMNDEDPTPQGDYADYVEECIDREESIGDPTAETGDGSGCITGGENADRNKMFRLFYIDQSIQDGMDSEYDEGNGKGDSSNGGAADFTVAAYNVLRDSDKKHNAQVCSAAGKPNNAACFNDRMQLQANIIQGKSELKNNQFDIVMANEMSTRNYSALKSKLSGYDGVFDSEYAVLWNTSKFTKVGGGTSQQNTGGGKVRSAPWVQLKSESGRMVYAMPLHYSSFPQFNGSPTQAKIGAKRTLDWIKSKAIDKEAIVIAGGDAGYFANAAATVFNPSGVVQNTALMSAGKPSSGNEKGRGADQAYITPISGLSVKNFQRPAEKKGSIIVKASDHAPIYFDVSVAGDSAATTGSDIGGDDYKTECTKYIGAVSCPGGGYAGECVSFVKFRLAKHGIKKADTSLGNGGYVTNTLGRKLGVKVNRTPAVHSVFSTFHTSHPSVGHTGMVSEVKPNGDIVIEEYNYNKDHGYGTRTIKKSKYQSEKWTFAHTETMYK